MTSYNTKTIEDILQHIVGGKYSYNSPFYKGDYNFRTSEIDYEYSNVEANEIVMCANDIVYFAENYCTIKTPYGILPSALYEYQKNILKNLQQNKNIIINSSRQMRITTTYAIYVLWCIKFKPDQLILSVGVKHNRLFDVVIELMKRLPFFMKPGIVEKSIKAISFDNGNCLTTDKNILHIKDKDNKPIHINKIFIENFAFIRGAEQSKLENTLIEHNRPNTSINISSCPNGKNLFYKIWSDSIEGRNNFIPITVNWNLIPHRDEGWKKQEIENIGEDAFEKQYGNVFQ